MRKVVVELWIGGVAVLDTLPMNKKEARVIVGNWIKSNTGNGVECFLIIKPQEDEEKKKCTQCKSEKTLSSFCRNSPSKDGRNGVCKECRRLNYQLQKIDTSNCGENFIEKYNRNWQF